MIVEIEEFSFRNIIPQFREFNSAVRENRARLTPYFWWADINSISRFNFILSGVLTEKLTRVMRDLPYNKKFIIRADGEFAGTIGLDDAAQNAYRAELWIFVTAKHAGAHVASHSIKLIEEYASKKSIQNIYARTDEQNWNSRNMLAANNYELKQTKSNFWRNVIELRWNKTIKTKTVEK
ncbi:MAG: GNAT family N-acetyltransferase [Alphaproteobacteria bacterium]|nr:GNAT family N-acetyltransferase [Alphaproteobacteria bacterium]